ncbi:MAG: VIT1/CCC1 transporter family protein [Candidatus Omnitrophica bacterium]|nr:VIT1/CCC1 transporter family protein [Candidatus Omnitrophota bacterium]
MIEQLLYERILQAQRSEITEHFIYKNLSRIIKDKENSRVLLRIAKDELRHYGFWKKISRQSIRPNGLKIILYTIIARVFGLTFTIKLMENIEDLVQDEYAVLKNVHPDVARIIQDEENHEHQLIALINEERLLYVSSMVLGLNDALVELTGALAGLTLALQNTRLVAIVGLITGIAASMSMSASEYLAIKHEETKKSPLKASIYAGCAYVLTVLFLIFPYLIFKNIFVCLGLVMFNALLVILVFTFYISVAKSLSFKKRFFEMASISLGIAIINFFIGIVIRKVFGIDA